MYIYDLRYIEKLDITKQDELNRAWDECHIVSALQGLVNRDSAILYLYAISHPYSENILIDKYWLDYMRSPGHWLENSPIEEIDSLDNLLKQFKQYYHGLVIYDPKVAATSNLASTIAGVENLLPVQFNPNPTSLYFHLVNELKIPIKISLVKDNGETLFTGKGFIPGTNIKSTGSSKIDCYLWGKEEYIDSGKCNPIKLGYYLDSYWLINPKASSIWNHTLTNHDYFISHRGFFLDLSPWDDEVPIDDTMQSPVMERETLLNILLSCYKASSGKKMIHIGGFVPWAFKYTDYPGAGGKHGGVPTEWEFVKVASAYNAYLDADALGLCAMANASFYQHYPLKERYPQNPKPIYSQSNRQKIKLNKKYFMFYVGDFDSAAWMYQMIPKLWNHPERGKIPLAWAFNPNLCERIPVAFDYTRETKTKNDFFITGDSGAGYVNPGMLCEPRPISNLPSGMEVWKEYCMKYYKQWDLEITGFIIDGHSPGMSQEGYEAYSKFSPEGIVGFKLLNSELMGLYRTMPYIRMTKDLRGTPEEAAQIIVKQLEKKKIPFGVFRGVLHTSDWFNQIVEVINTQYAEENIEFLDPYTFFSLLRDYLQKK